MFKILSYSFLALAVISCGSGRGKLDELNAPKWVFDPYESRNKKVEFAAVGLSEPTGTLRNKITQAEVNGLGNLAASIGSEVAKVARDVSKNVKESERERSYQEFSNITEQIVRDLNIRPSRVAIWQSPKDDTVAVLMIADKDEALKSYANALKIYEEKMKDKNFIYIADKIRAELATQVSGSGDTATVSAPAPAKAQ